MKTEEEVNEKEIESKIRTRLEAEYARKFEADITVLREQNSEALQKALEDWKKDFKPPTQEELKTLLNQEYAEFPIRVSTKDGIRDFVIRELPQSVEKKFYKLLKEKIKTRVNELADLTIKIAEGDLENKFMSLMEIIDSSFDVFNETVVLILDPFGTEQISSDWVQENISSFRQWNIILAQERANRIRDFFSSVSRSSLSGTMRVVSSQV